MLIWDHQLGPYKNDLALLDQQKRLEVGLASISMVRDSAMEVLQEGPLHAIDFYNAAITLIHRVNEVRDIPKDQSQSLLESTSEWLPSTGAGVRDVSMCMIMILQRAGGSLVESDVFGVLSYAYQVVLYREVLLKLQREVTETEVRQMETASSDCMACITAQIKLITDAVRGTSTRST